MPRCLRRKFQIWKERQGGGRLTRFLALELSACSWGESDERLLSVAPASVLDAASAAGTLL